VKIIIYYISIELELLQFSWRFIMVLRSLKSSKEHRYYKTQKLICFGSQRILKNFRSGLKVKDCTGAGNDVFKE
jgi:hypothetical protein